METDTSSDSVSFGAAGNDVSAVVTEVFASVQGEGPWVGMRQVFVRLHGCNRDCAYCDAPETKGPAGPCMVETAHGSGQLAPVPNRFDVHGLTNVVRALAAPSDVHSVAITGGEPLLQHRFLARWLPSLRAAGYAVYLETNGQLADLLANVIQWVDYVSMDLKLPSSTGEDAIWEQHAAFLRVCRDHGTPTYAKAVVTPQTPDAEIELCARLVEEAWPAVPLVLQPVTPMGPVTEAPRFLRMMELQRMAMALHHDVRVIPQAHRLMGAR